MRKTKNVLFLFVFLLGLLAVRPAQAAHIAGAELTYECLGNNDYLIRLKLYRDCNGNGAQFDNPLTLYVFEAASGQVYNIFDFVVPFNTPEIIPDNWDACVSTSYPFCVEEGIYEGVINLPPNAGGYHIGWSRCCRNNSITNLADPGCEGVSFLATVPSASVAVCNSMPTFNQNPSLFLCTGEPFFFDYSATDPDGDSLAYVITNPYTGTDLSVPPQGTGGNVGAVGGCNTNLGPVLQPGFQDMAPPPYANVNFGVGYTFLNPFGPGSSLDINPTTGFLEAFPASQGTYVLSVSVLEYRNGVLLSENKRDFQFYVINCLPQGPPPAVTSNLTGLPTNGDTILALAGQPFCYDFTVSDPATPSNITVTPLSVAFGGNGGFPPPYATITINGTTPPVDGQICWQPSCDYVGDAVPLIISARDTNDCPNYNIVFDTVWVRVIEPPAAPPVTDHDFSPVNLSNGDTIIIGPQESFCYNFFVVDTFGAGNLSYENILTDINGNPLNQVQGVTSFIQNDTLFGEVCWQGFCNYGFTYMFITRGIDEFQCPPNNVSADTVYLRVLTPFNPPPTITTDITGNPVNNDTIQATVHEEFCFNFQVIDTSIIAGDSLQINYEIEDLDGNRAGGEFPLYFATLSGDTINGQFCWTPRCVNNDEVFRFIVVGIQINECFIQAEAYDTVYIRVTEPVNPPPLISHDLGALSVDNYTLPLADDESFCYDFEIVDVQQPTYLEYETEVVLANGAPFTGSRPTIVINASLDSLILGEVCWTIPCELANQDFKIRLVGRDTFDCTEANTVYDSVLVQHTENAPAAPSMCYVSVLPGDSGVFVQWEPNTESDGRRYVVFRGANTGSLVAVDTIVGYSDSTWVDMDVAVDDMQYCYALQAVDRCGNVSPVGDQACTILLTGVQDEYDAILDWTGYTGWLPAPLGYSLFQLFPVLGPDATERIDFDNFTFTYTDQSSTQPRVCYVVSAAAPGGACGDSTRSNEVCINFPATLFVPNAFSPNGDGLNDIFTSAGEFEARFNLQIYDRWGKLLFETNNKVAGWDGTVNGQPQPEGVYVFRMEVEGFDGEVLRRHGSVILYR